MRSEINEKPEKKSLRREPKRIMRRTVKRRRFPRLFSERFLGGSLRGDPLTFDVQEEGVALGGTFGVGGAARVEPGVAPRHRLQDQRLIGYDRSRAGVVRQVLSLEKTGDDESRKEKLFPGTWKTFSSAVKSSRSANV